MLKKTYVTVRISLALLVSLLLLVSCASKSPAPEKSSKAGQNQRSIDQMNKAFDELNSGSATQPSKPTDGSSYSKSIYEAEKAQKELECAIKGNCPVDSNQPSPSAPVSPSAAVQDKSRPTAVNEAASPLKGTKYPIVDGYPVWFHRPGHDGYIGGVGIAPKQKSGDRIAQRRVAVTLAQADIARSIKVNINNELTSEKYLVDSKNQSYYKEKFSSMSKQQTNDYISNPQVMDEWTNEKTGEILVWVVLPK
ncbi:MAG: LPP20 family lipoprotein [Deferribacteraceae bacterium]|jgi:hypothetical protein|nr:LPP20 family lipoprotein [Deferribacteraceae bacterium]